MNMKIIPSFELNEYLLVLTPHEALAKEITSIKKQFAETYNNNNAVHSRVQIMLGKFYHYTATEQRLVSRLNAVMSRISSFSVELEDFGSLPTHTIYLNVKTKNRIHDIVKQIKEAKILLSLSKEHKPFYPEDPYITIARKLVPYQFEKGWLEYSNTHFRGSFMANQLTLLKFDARAERYTQVHKFNFLNQQVDVKQGNLFG
jgi:2'-5' RNA ligase